MWLIFFIWKGDPMKLPAIRQLPSGNWFCRLRLDGKEICITEPSKEKCQARAMAYKTGVLQARLEPLSITLRQACDQYIDARRGVASPTTIESYEKISAQYFQGLMGQRLSAITGRALSLAVQRERQRISRRGAPLSAKTIKSALGFVRAVLKENGAQLDRVTAPEVKRKIVLLPDPPAVIRALVGSEIELPGLLAAWLSLSMSEIRGLTKSKSIVGRQLYVAETLVRVRAADQQAPATKNGTPRKNKGVYHDVRKEGGKEVERSRVLDIPPYIMGLIDQVEGDVLVPLTMRQIERRFSNLLQAHGLPHMTFHQLRHLNASTMAMLGIQKEIAQDRGGWKTSYTMDQVYTHVFSGPRQAADRKIDAYFSALVAPDPVARLLRNGNESATKPRKRRIYKRLK